jgi:hypothetical protein
MSDEIVFEMLFGDLALLGKSSNTGCIVYAG